MHQDLNISVLIPTHNEEAAIGRVLNDIPAMVDEVVVIDWNSSDRTREIAGEYGVRVIEEPRRGYGRAYLTGVQESTGDIAITLDADGTYPVDHIPHLVGLLVGRELDFISCSRFPLLDHGAMNGINRVGNRGLTFIANALFGTRLNDLLSGMWVFRRRTWDDLGARSDNWNLSQEVKLRAAKTLGPKFAEAKIPYADRMGESKLSPLQVGWENLMHLIELRREIGGIDWESGKIMVDA